MSASTLVESKVAVGTTFALASAWNSGKRYTMVQADSANTGIIYCGGSAAVTAATGFGELEAGQVVTFLGSAAVYVISGEVSQNVRVIEGRA
jgi:hypothetical protein